jgi:hypothetical protein
MHSHAPRAPVQIRAGGKRRWGIYHHKSCGETTPLHVYHSKAQTVVPIQRNSETDEVAKGQKT